MYDMPYARPGVVWWIVPLSSQPITNERSTKAFCLSHPKQNVTCVFCGARVREMIDITFWKP